VQDDWLFAINAKIHIVSRLQRICSSGGGAVLQIHFVLSAKILSIANKCERYCNIKILSAAKIVKRYSVLTARFFPTVTSVKRYSALNAKILSEDCEEMLP
jgi:hypothetical protein